MLNAQTRVFFMGMALFIHFFCARLFLLVYSNNNFSTLIYTRKFITGLLYDLHITLLIVLFFYLIELIYRKALNLKSISFYILFLSLSFLDYINFSIYRYFLSGLSNYGMILEYIKDLDQITKMGAKTFNPLPFLVFFSPVLIFSFRKKLKRINLRFKTYKFIFFLFFANVVCNQLVKITRITKTEVLETNTIARLYRGGQQDVAIFKQIQKMIKRGISKENLGILQNKSNVKYLNQQFPLVKTDYLKPVTTELNKPNIIFIGLESVSAFSTGIKESFSKKDKKLFRDLPSFTPFMDSLLPKSYIVPEFYAHGTFTTLAQISILCSIYDPVSAVDGKGSIMRSYPELDLKCLPHYLKELGYTNYFYNGYRNTFDNKHIFMPRAGFDHLIFRKELKEHFNLKEWQHTWGMTDQTVLRHMLANLNNVKEPFMSFFMSVDTHPPYDHLKAKPENMTAHEASLLKLDQTLKSFFNNAKKQKWFDNTIFIFVADNGTSFSQLSNLPKLDSKTYYNRVPFFIYSKNLEQFFSGKRHPFRASQVDIAPTILHLIGLTNTTNHFIGSSLFEVKSAPFVFQYKYHNNFFTIPESNKVQSLKELFMYFVLQNKIWNNDQFLIRTARGRL